MRQCPKCGKNENEIEQTTMYEANKAKCPCGWEGSVDDLVEEKKAAPAKVEKVEKVEKPAKEDKGPEAGGVSGEPKAAGLDKPSA